MKASLVLDLLSSAGIEATKGGWHGRLGGTRLYVSCPFARFEKSHKSETDSHPSMSVVVRENELSPVRCFTCSRRGSSIVELFEQLSVCDPSYAKFVADAQGAEHVDLQAIADSIPTYGAVVPDTNPRTVFPEEWLGVFRGKFHPYLAGRGVSMDTARTWGLGYDDSQKRAVIPCRDRAGRLVGAVGRGIHAGVDPRYWNYWNFDKSRVLLGEHLVRRGSALVLVEGPLDAVLLSQSLPDDYSVVSTMGTNISAAQLERVLSLASGEVVLAMDNDPAGRKATDHIGARLARKVILSAVEYPPGTEGDDPGKLQAAMWPLIEDAPLWGMSL